MVNDTVLGFYSAFMSLVKIMQLKTLLCFFGPLLFFLAHHDSKFEILQTGLEYLSSYLFIYLFQNNK